MHPLVNLSEIKDQDLQNQIADLTKKYFIARSSELKMQIANMLDMYNEEVSNRAMKQWEEQVKNQDSGLDKLINID